MRPFFSSVALPWSKALGWQHLQSELGTLVPRFTPAQQIMIHPDSLHLTAFANFRINWWNGKRQTGEQRALELLKQLTEGKPQMLSEMRAAFRPITLEAYELTCFDSVTAVQFRSKGDELSNFRKRLNELLRDPIDALVKEGLHPDDAKPYEEWAKANGGKPAFESLCSDPNKNSGGNGFGSVARSPVTTEVVVKRWVRPIGPVEMRFSAALLTTSDEALTNPAMRDAIQIS